MPIHIFWDNSNIWLSAKNLCDKNEDNVPRDALRIHFLNLHNLVAKGREINTKVISGSIPPDSELLWNHPNNLGYNTHLLKRVEDESTSKLVEQSVDESLHLAMANIVLEYINRDPASQTMVLLSGDSKVSDQGTSFPGQLESALRNGWNAEVYTWSNSYSQPIYQKLLGRYDGKIQIIELDGYYYNITYIKGKSYNCNWRGASTGRTNQYISEP